MPSRRSSDGSNRQRGLSRTLRTFVGAALALGVTSCDGKSAAAAAALNSSSGSAKFAEVSPGIGYANERVAEVPWSIHIARVDRTGPEISIHSVHAQRRALGLGPLSEQVRELPAAFGIPVAAVNGDFYQRDRAYAGDPRGLQIVEGELLSAPNGGAVFWTDAAGQPHATNIVSRFQASWPDGTITPFGLNQECRPDAVVLYTPAVGASTRTSSGRELILAPQGEVAGVPIRSDLDFAAQVQEVREGGDTALRSGSLVLSVGPALAKKLPRVAVGAVVRISTATSVGLRGAGTALGGGPVLVRNGKRQKIAPPPGGAYEFSSMLERHPRTAVGWDPHYFYLIEVDGRQEGLSVGMTLDELAAYMIQLG